MLKTVRTKLSKNSPTAVETKCTIDFHGVSRDEIEALAARAVVIEEQAIWRISGKIPAECTIKVREMLDRPRGQGVPATPEAIFAKFLKMTPEQKAEFLKNAEKAK